MNPLAIDLNETIEHRSPVVFSLLSKRGKQAYFPSKGILAQAAEAKTKAINATIGEAVEDDGSPMRLDVIAKNIAINPKLSFPYAPSYGRPDIRETWKKMLFEKNPALSEKDISLPVVSSALTHGLSIAGYLFVDEGDTLYMADICWDNYSLIFSNGYGAHLENFNLFNGGRLDLDSMREALVDGPIGKKIVLLNFPNNPTGYTPTIDEAKGLIKVLTDSADKGNHLVVILDDAYFGLVYEEGIECQSLFAYLADLHRNILALKLDGPTKEDYVWGFRVGFMTYGIRHGSKELYTALETKTAGAIRGNISNVSNLSQSLLHAAYQSAEYSAEKQGKFDLLRDRYEMVKKTLADHPEYQEWFEALPYNSGYFMCVGLKHGLDGEMVRQILLKEFDTGLIFISNVLRVAYS